MADIIARHAPSDAVIVSLQNGVGNVAVLRDRLPGRRVLGGMVPFNVIALGEGRFHRATSGDIVIEQDEARTAEQLSVPGLTMRPDRQHHRRAMGQAAGQSQQRAQRAGGPAATPAARTAVVSAIAGGPDGGGLAAIKAEGIQPVASTPVPAGWTPHLLRLPDAVLDFAGTGHEDRPEARSSMWEDLQPPPARRDRLSAGRDHWNCRTAWAQSPALARIVALIRRAEARGQGFARADAGANSRGELIWQRASDLLEMGWSSGFRQREGEANETNRSGAHGGGRPRWLGVARLPAHAVPPTATPSPGYDARLQEQRAAQRRHVEPALKPPKRRGKSAPAH